jgi:hypothetical protein
MNWEGCEKTMWPNLRYYPGICPENLRKITKNIRQDSLFPGGALKPGPPKYEPGTKTVHQ